MAALLPLVLALSWAPSAALGFRDDFTRTVTSTLDNLLNASYDKRIRPGFGGPPTQVTVNMHIKSLGPVSENDESYDMDVYFRQIWYDTRLTYTLEGLDEFSMSWIFLDKVWKPDTFFMNGKKSYLHRITSPNKFLRLRKDGLLTYSMRLTLSARCKMHLRKFPLDSQVCRLIIGSYGYTAQDVVYTWADKGVGLESGLEMAQYDLVNISVAEKQFALRGKDEYSVIQASFHLRRSTGYFLLQIYVPCSLIVCSSWVSFWINPTDAAGRVSLGVTTVLSITTMGFGGRAQLPKVPYATALDWFIIVCFSFAFAVLVEYAVINFISKLTADIRKILEERAKRKKSKEEKEATPVVEQVQVPSIVVEQFDLDKGEDLDKEKCKFIDEEEWGEEGMLGKPKPLEPRKWFSVPNILAAVNAGSLDLFRKKGDEESGEEVLGAGGGERRPPFSLREKILVPLRYWQSIHLLPREEDVDLKEAPVHKFSKIDIMARRLFPLSFSLFLLTYGLMYTFFIPDTVKFQ